MSCRNCDNDTGTFQHSDIPSFEIQTEDMDNRPYRALLVSGWLHSPPICLLEFVKMKQGVAVTVGEGLTKWDEKTPHHRLPPSLLPPPSSPPPPPLPTTPPLSLSCSILLNHKFKKTDKVKPPTDHLLMMSLYICITLHIPLHLHHAPHPSTSASADHLPLHLHDPCLTLWWPAAVTHFMTCCRITQCSMTGAYSAAGFTI